MPTWTGNGSTNNWSEGANWDTLSAPTLATNALFPGTGANGNKNVTITFAATCTNLDFTGYSGTATFTNTLTIRGSGVNLGTTVTIAGSAGITINSTVTASFTANGLAFNQPIIYNSNGTAGFTHTYDNWSITSFTTNFIGGNPILIAGGSTITLTGSMLISQVLTAPTVTFRMTGTGTLASGVNCSALIRIDSGANTTTVSNLSIINGSLTYVSGVISASGQLNTLGTCSLDLQNQLFSNYFQTFATNVTLISDANFNNVTMGANGGTSCVLNSAGFRLKARGNFTFSQTNANLTGTGIVSLIGSGNINFTIGNSVNVDFEINTSGSYTFVSNSFFGGAGKSFTHTAGIVNPGLFTTTFGVASPTVATYTLNISNINWYNIIFLLNNNGTNTINLPLIVTNNLTLNGTTVFTGTAGWTCANLLCSVAGTITLQNSVSYRTTTSVNLLGTNLQRITMTSNDATVRAIWTLDQGATQSIVYVDGTRINSSLGQTIWSFGSTLTNTLNWNVGSQLPNYGFISFS